MHHLAILVILVIHHVVIESSHSVVTRCEFYATKIHITLRLIKLSA
jgi:hypothetical protein